VPIDTAVTNDTPRGASPWRGSNVGSHIAQHTDALRDKAHEFYAGERGGFGGVRDGRSYQEHELQHAIQEEFNRI